MFDGWAEPCGVPTTPMVVAVVGVGVATAVAFPSGRPGLGVLLTAVAVVVAAAGVEWSTRRGAFSLPGVGWTALTIALAAVGTVRAAEWLAGLCMLAAFGTGTLAVAGRSATGVARAAAVVLTAMFRSVPWFAIAPGRRGGARRAARIGVAALVGVLLLAVFVPLMTSADPAFDRLVVDLTPTVDGPSVVRWLVLFALATLGMEGICYLSVSAPVPNSSPAPRARLAGLEWTVPVSLLVALFALFVGVQLATLFGSAGYVLATTGLTYAEYARTGFWQLLWVTVLAFGVIVAAARVAPALSVRQRAWKRGLLGALAVLTLVVVASATHRMVLYQEAYGFTVSRLVVLTCEIWLGVAFVLVLGSVLRLREHAPTMTMVATGAITLLALAAVNPEQVVVEQNAARSAATGQFDVGYLQQLSADAVPAIQALPEPYRSCALAELDDAGPDDWRSANLARSKARALLAAHPAQLCAGRATS